MTDELKKKEWWEEASDNAGSDFYDLKVGSSRVRVLTRFERVNSLFQGVYPNSKYIGKVDDNYVPKDNEKVNVQGWAWIIDRATGELKIAQFGRAILTAITALKNNPDYAFDDFPMPYDITINNTGEGANRYTITPARQNTEVTEEEMAQLNKKKTIADIIVAIDNKQKKSPDYPESNESNSAGKF